MQDIQKLDNVIPRTPVAYVSCSPVLSIWFHIDSEGRAAPDNLLLPFSVALYVPWRSPNQVVRLKLFSFLDLTRSEPKVVWQQAFREDNIIQTGDLRLILHLSWDLTKSILSITANCCATADCFQQRKYNFEMLWFTAQCLLVWNKAVSPFYVYGRDMKEKVKTLLFP